MKCCELPYGSNLCHCARCHQTFSGLTLFDRHQDVDYNRTPAVSCIEPEALGLLMDTKGTWRTREGLLMSTEKVARMATAKAARNRKAA